MQLLTTLTTLSLFALRVVGWPFGLYYDDICDMRARSVVRTPILDECLVMTNTMGPAFIAVKGSVGDGLDWDKKYELCLYDKKPDCWHDKVVNCFSVGQNNCTRLHSGTHVIKFRAIPPGHTNMLVSQNGQD